MVVDNELIFDGASFWNHLDVFGKLNRAGTDEPTIAVVGGGETAASIVVEFLALLPKAKIWVMNGQGVIFSRGENYHENSLYTKPDGWWDKMSLEHRVEFIRRTDRGVFSQASLEAMTRAERIFPIACKVVDVAVAQEGSRRFVNVVGSDGTSHVADFVISALGFDALWFRSLMTGSKLRGLTVVDEHAISLAIKTDLSVGEKIFEGSPRLHLPFLAAIAQGPGFPNLSCLGTLSDRILQSYATKP